MDNMSIEELMARWISYSEEPETPHPDDEVEPDSSEDVFEGDRCADTTEMVDMSRIDKSRIEHAVETVSYEWLTSAIKTRQLLDYSNATILNSIWDTMSFGLRGSSGSQAHRIQSVSVMMHWDPLSFVEKQGYEAADSLFTALTISGADTNIQLLTCMQYVRQTWPMVGEAVVSGLVEAMDSVGSDLAELPSKTTESKLIRPNDLGGGASLRNAQNCYPTARRLELVSSKESQLGLIAPDCSIPCVKPSRFWLGLVPLCANLQSAISSGLVSH